MLWKLFAVILITLTALPFTAPFSTCDLTVVDAIHQASDFLSASKVVQDVAAMPSAGAGSLPVQATERVHLRTAVLFSPAGEARPLVLRL